MPGLPFLRRGPAGEGFVDRTPQMRDAPPPAAPSADAPPLPGTPTPVAPGSAYVAAGVEPKPATRQPRTAVGERDSVGLIAEPAAAGCVRCRGRDLRERDLRNQIAELRRENTQLRYGGAPGGVSRKRTE